jgi:uncharacterized protein
MQMQAKSERFEMRLDEEMLSRIDGWRSAQSDVPSRAEAVRQLIEIGLPTKRHISLSDGEKLLLLMVGDVQRALKIRGDIDTEFIEKVIHGGHFWALDFKYPGVFHGSDDDKAVVKEVLDILEMWSALAWSLGKLGKVARDQIKTDYPNADQVFPGFCGNHESDHLSIAKFFVSDLDRYVDLRDVVVNSHSATLTIHRRMLQTFRPMRGRLAGGVLTAGQIAEVLKAQSANFY